MPSVVLPADTPPPNDLPPAQASKLWQAAKNFEAMAIGEMLTPMFNTVDTAHGLFGGGDGEAAWRPMLIQEIGKQMEAHGGLHLAASVFQALLRKQEGTKP